MTARRNYIIQSICCCLALTAFLHATPVTAGEDDGLISTDEPGWPQWRGPRRDGISDETGLLKTWPEDGPELLWTAGGLGGGYSSPIITDKHIYLTGDVGRELRVFALNLDGERVWTGKNGRNWRKPHPGARGCCAYSDGCIYNINAHGRVACLDAKTGREIWAVNMLEPFDGKNIRWAISECILVDGPNVIVTPGGKKAFMAALNKKTGETAWTSEPLEDPDTQRTGYASPILFRLNGRRMLATMALRALVCVDADSGKLLWTFAKRSKYDANCATPTLCGEGIFFAMPTHSGGVMLKTVFDGKDVSVEKEWECRMDNLSGGMVSLGDYLYGSGERNKGWYCFDVETGEEKYRSTAIVQGSLIYADERLYCLSERGVMTLVKPGPQKFDIVSRFRLIDPGKRDVWAHPVILDGKLYLRYHDKLYCYDISSAE